MLNQLKARAKWPTCIIVYWRDIPGQVIVKKGRQNAKRELPLRFTEAIDMCAMRTGAGDTDDYLAEWRKADPVPVGDDLEAEADKAMAETRSEVRPASGWSLSSRQAARTNGLSTPEPTVTQATLVKKAAPKRDYKPADVSPQRRVAALLSPCGCGRSAIRARWNGSTRASPTPS